MTRFSSILGMTVTIALAVSLTACEYKELETLQAETKTFTVDFCHDKVDSVPSRYRVAFYPADEESGLFISQGVMLFDVPAKGRTLVLPEGRYMVTAWNNDTEHTVVEDYTDRKTVNATTLEYASHDTEDTQDATRIAERIHHEQGVLDYPDYMVHANKDLWELKEPGQRLTLHPDSMVVTVDVVIHGIRGLKKVRRSRGSLSNVAKRRFIGCDNVTADTTAVVFDCHVNRKEETLESTFYVFGIEPTTKPRHNHTMVLYFWLAETKVYIPLDITEAVAAIPKDAARATIELYVDIDISECTRKEGGFFVDVEEWNTEVVRLMF